MITYDKMKIEMIKKGITFKYLRENKILTPKTIAKINKNEYVDLETLEKLAIILDCQIGDLVEIKNEKNSPSD